LSHFKLKPKIVSLSMRIKRRWQLYLFLLLPIFYIILFCYVPMFGLQIAFKKYSVRLGIWGSPWVGFDQFRKFFSSYYFGRTVGNTLRLSIYSIVAGFPIPILLALMFNCVRTSILRKTAQNIMYMPHFISVVVIVGIINQVFGGSTGLFAQIYKTLNPGRDAPNLLLNADAFPHLYTWSGIWQSMGWSTVIYTAALSSADPTLHEAAVIDGASRVRRILTVDLPAIIPTIAITLILRFGSIMGIGFDKVYLMQNDVNLRTSEVISTYTYKVGLTSKLDYSYSTAIGMFNSVIGLIMLVTVNTISRKVSENSLW
jgi:putative aldouronate transport system permease protein